MSGFTLAALGGAPAGPDLVDDLKQLGDLPPATADALWPVIERNLASEISPPVARFVASFCSDHDVTENDLVPVVRAVRQLFRQGAARDVAVAEMVRDLNQLCGTEPDIVKRVSGWYERALPLIRTMMVVDGMRDFGPTLESVKLRTSYVPTSSHHPSMMVPIVELALAYRDGTEIKRLSLQVSPLVAAQLKAACADL